MLSLITKLFLSLQTTDIHTNINSFFFNLGETLYVKATDERFFFFFL